MMYPNGDKIRFHAAVGQRLREKREAAGMSQRELADTLGISKSHLQKIEEGVQTPTVYLLAKAADEWDCTLDDLVPVLTGR